MNEYTIVDGTAFNKDTPRSVIDIMNRFLHTKKRLRLYYGDPNTGRDWGETHDIEGYIGRSTGQYKVPLLIANRRSMGGGAILTANIVKIEYANKKDGGVLLRHPNYHR